MITRNETKNDGTKIVNEYQNNEIIKKTITNNVGCKTITYDTKNKTRTDVA